MDIVFHYPPELLQLLIDAIPKLCRSKRDLLVFFQGAGVPRGLLTPYSNLLINSKYSFSKYNVARELLVALNEMGESSLRERRELLKRVTEFEDFGLCWDQDRAAARGLVAQIRDVINVKDSFTRMKMEKDEERRRRLSEKEAEVKALREKNGRREKVKDELFSLFSESDAVKRGKALEVVLNSLFSCYDILVRESFTVRGKCGEGVIEQIDGLIEIDGNLYLAEMKWWNTSIGVNEIAPHLVRIFTRAGQARGIFISYTDFTNPAIEQCRQAINGGAVVVLSTLQEIISLLNENGDFKKWLKKKVELSIIDKNPYRYVGCSDLI